MEDAKQWYDKTLPPLPTDNVYCLVARAEKVLGIEATNMDDLVRESHKVSDQFKGKSV